MTKNQVHEWHYTVSEGVKRYYRGYWNSREWRFSILDKEVRAWVPVEKPDLDLWEQLRDVLFRKYQRKRLSFSLLDGVDKILLLVREGKEPPKPRVSEKKSPLTERSPRRRREDR